MPFDQWLKRNNHFNLVGEIDVFVVAISGVISQVQCCVKIMPFSRCKSELQNGQNKKK